MILVNALQSVLSILVMISIGYILTHKGWINEETSNLFSKLMVNISLPALMVYNLMTSFTKEELLSMMGGIIIPFAGIGLSYLISILVTKILKIDPSRRGLFRALFTFSNTIFIGLPVNLALFGEKSVPLVTLYYIANTTLFWTIGLYGIKKDSKKNDKGKISLISLETFKRILSPILVAYIISVILILMEIDLPKFIIDSCKYMGNLTTPLSMLFIGIIIHSIDFKSLKFNRDMIVILIGRFLITPMLIFFMFKFFSRPVLTQKVYVIEAAMPVMTTIAIVGQAYDSDYEYATVVVTVSILISLLIIPAYMLLLSL